MIRRRAIVLFLTLAPLAGFAPGCARPQNTTPAHTVYNGPTEPLDVVLARIDANNGRITSVAGSGTFLATIVDKGKRQELNGQITILHTKPGKLWLRLNKDIAGEILRAGVNDQQFWLTIRGDLDTTWYGTPRGPAQQNTRLPLSPEMIADVLGVATLNLDLLAQPIPTMRFNPDYDAYMLTWHQPLKDRWVTLREVWYDRASLEPRFIWLFDRDGRVTLRAKLSDVEPMSDSADGQQPPRVARSFDLLFPESGSKLTFHLDELGSHRGGAPNAMTYRFDPARAGTSHVENLDEAAR